MRIDDLRFFVRVCENNSISQTAKEYYITQQGLSRIIASLENELGIKLFLREGKTLTLTPEGEIVRQSAIRMEAEYTHLLKSLNSYSLEMDPEEKLQYFIYATPVMCITILPRILSNLTTAFPNVQFNIIEKGPKEIVDETDFTENSIGVLSILSYLREDCMRLQSGELHFNEMYSDVVVLSVAKDSELSGKGLLHLEELHGYPLVLHHTEMLIARTLLGDAMDKMSVTHTTNHALVRRIVEKGLAVGLTSELIECFMPNDAADMVPIEKETRVHYGCVYAGDRERGILSREIERLVANELKKASQQKKTDPGRGTAGT